MAQFKLENEDAVVVIDEHASEVVSFINKESGIEHIWQADPQYWGQHNPTLFPMVGKVYDGNIDLKGKIYHMGNHGFARHADFTCIKHDENEVKMQLKQSKETLAQYPYNFTLEITYTLKGKDLSIHYTIENNNDEMMPFNFGLHPAFNCPLEDGKLFEDYHIEFDQAETFHDRDLYMQDSMDLPLVRSLLEKTVIIKDPKSSVFTLTDKDHKHGTKVLAKNYPWVAFWSPMAPFVCIEPWYSHTDFEPTNKTFIEREGTICLDANKSWSCAYQISVF